jgi:hypothetical protein
MKIKSVIGFNLSSQNLDVIAAWRLIKMRAAGVKKVLRRGETRLRHSQAHLEIKMPDWKFQSGMMR